MNRLLPAALCFCAAAFLSNPAWSFQGFDLFEQIQHSIECARKPDADYLTCSGKLTPADEEEEEEVTSTEPEPTPEPTPVSVEPQYDLYNRDVTELTGLIDFPECADANPNKIKFMMDVDLDGDQDVIMGFECIMYTQDEQDLKDQLTYDEFYGWISDSYLAVFINDNGEFRNDQLIFDGEYPVYDKTLKSWWPINVGDVNGDGYDDVVIQHHWDNSTYDSINHTMLRNCEEKCGFTASGVWSAGTVMISDGNGGYKTHLLPMQFGEGMPQFYTDELGDTYVWIFADKNTMYTHDGVYDDYLKRELDLEVRPYVGKVSGADLIDVTDRYWEKIYPHSTRDRAKYCYIARDKAVDGEYPLHAHYIWQMPCSNPDNWLPTNYAVEHMAGKIYVAPLRHVMHSQIYTGDDRIAHCKSPDWESQGEAGGRLERQCVVDASTTQPWMFDSLAVLAMDSERGVYVENTHEHLGEWRYYLKDPDVPVSEGGEYEALFFIHMGDQIQINFWGWGLAIAEEQSTGDIIALSNQGGIMLDPGATADDVEELANFILREFDPRAGNWSNSIALNLTFPQTVFEIMAAGFCPDVLELVEPEDCIEPEYWTENMTNRYQTFGRDNGFSIGHRVSANNGVIVSVPQLTGLTMAYNPYRTDLIDFDSDGDLDLYISDNNQHCGPMCLYENVGDYEFEQNLEGIWADADDAFWNFQSEQCMGPQVPEDGVWGKSRMCDLSDPTTDIDKLLRVPRGQISITDVDGDGILDFNALKYDHYWGRDKWVHGVNLNIIYGE